MTTCFATAPEWVLYLRYWELSQSSIYNNKAGWSLVISGEMWSVDIVSAPPPSTHLIISGFCDDVLLHIFLHLNIASHYDLFILVCVQTSIEVESVNFEVIGGGGLQWVFELEILTAISLYCNFQCQKQIFHNTNQVWQVSLKSYLSRVFCSSHTDLVCTKNVRQYSPAWWECLSLYSPE